MSGIDRTLVPEAPVYPVSGREPRECLTPGCWREPYEDGLCKKHSDEAWGRAQLAAQRRTEAVGR